MAARRGDRGRKAHLSMTVYVPPQRLIRRLDIATGVGAATVWRWTAALALAAALSACGGGGKTTEDPLALEGDPSTP